MRNSDGWRRGMALCERIPEQHHETLAKPAPPPSGHWRNRGNRRNLRHRGTTKGPMGTMGKSEAPGPAGRSQMHTTPAYGVQRVAW
jgi:hypothetical protein